MTGIANQRVSSTAVNMTAETNETVTNNIKNVQLFMGPLD